jgi:hypothetical protein
MSAFCFRGLIDNHALGCTYNDGILVAHEGGSLLGPQGAICDDASYWIKGHKSALFYYLHCKKVSVYCDSPFNRVDEKALFWGLASRENCVGFVSIPAVKDTSWMKEGSKRTDGNVQKTQRPVASMP